MDQLTDHEGSIRIAIFVVVLILMLLLEHISPRKNRTQARKRRWTTNLGLVVIDSIAIRLFVPVLAMGMASITTSRQWGIFNFLEWPSWLEVLLAVLILDMLIYWQHVASHYFPILWNIHKVHHVDRDFDATTGVRFHPIEIFLSMLYKLVCVIVLGPAVVAVFVFEVLLNATALFNHTNLLMPRKLDAFIRVLIVTPDMHRVHHSIKPHETNSNYGFNLSIWDRIFGSYIAQPSDGHDAMIIGIAQHQDSNPSSLRWSLWLPLATFRKSMAKEN